LDIGAALNNPPESIAGLKLLADASLVLDTGWLGSNRRHGQ
jgi:hypothetical protein